MTVEELEKENAKPETVAVPVVRLEKAAGAHYDSVEYLDPPKDFMRRTQAEVEALDE